MLFLSAAGQPQGDPVALAMVLALAMIVAVMALRKHRSHKNPAPKTVPSVEKRINAPKPEPQKAPGSAGKLKIHNVEPKTAAMLMAIIADKMGRPLNELRFISIKEVN